VTDPREKLLELLETSGRRLHALRYRLTLRADAAEDLLQELMLRLLQSSGFSRAESVEGYAVRAAVNLAFDWRRKRRCQVQSDESVGAALDDRTVHTSSRMEQSEQFERLASLDTLSAAQRDIVVLHFLEEESFEEIGRRLNRTPHQVRGLCQKGLQRLRSIHGKCIEPVTPSALALDEVRHEPR
jgi:RNA polymerase sigma factor (sigma-70 family)